MKPNKIGKLVLLAFFTTTLTSFADERLQLGGNFNEHSEMIRWELLEHSSTRVIRGFIPASPFLSGERKLASDLAVQNLKQAVSDGYDVILCLKWDFKKGNWRVPAAGSRLEQQCFEWVDGLLREVGDAIALEMINEIMVDSVEEDLLPDAHGLIPMVKFQQRLMDYLDSLDRPVPPVFMGGFTRLDREHMQAHPVTAAMLKWINSDDRIDGVNFHIHAPEIDTFKQALEYIRGKIVDKPLMVTEFSFVWKYKKALKHPVGRFAKGKVFAEGYSRDPNLSVREYINLSIDDPVPQSEWTAFLHSQYWYDPQFLDKSCELMNQYGVRYAAYAFQQGSSGPGKLREGSNPWILNPLYLPLTTVGKDDLPAVNEDFLNAYRKWR